MKLLNCHIVNFGCLSDRSYTFRDGLNVLYAENGSGKSTLTVFLKAMLYGLTTPGKNDIVGSERKRYAPWNGGKFGGSLSFSARGKEYRIERFFGKREKDDTFKLYDLATQKESNDFDSRPGSALFGVDADGFERSLFISQRAPFLPPENNTIRARLGSLLEAADDLGAYEDAAERLKTAFRSYVTTGNRGKVGDLEREIEQREEALKAAEEAKMNAERLTLEAEELKTGKADVEERIVAARKNRAQAEARRLLEQKSDSYRRICASVDTEKETLLPLNEFFKNGVPTETTLTDAEATLGALEASEAKLSLCRLSDEDTRVLHGLRAVYGAALEEAELARVRSVFEGYEAAKKSAEDTLPAQNSEFDALCLHFHEKEPTKEDIATLLKATEDYDNAEANLLVEEDLLAKRRKLSGKVLIPVIAGTLLVLLGILGLVLSFTVLGGIGCALGAAVLLLPLLLRAPSTKNSARAELQRTHAVLSALLLPYHYTEKNPSLSAKLLFKDIARFRALRAEKEQRARDHEDAIRKMHELEGALLVAFSHYGKAEMPFESAMRALTADADTYARLSKDEAAQKKQGEELSKKIGEAKAALSDFFAPFPLSTVSLREAFSTLREKLLLFSTASKRLSDAQRQLAVFLEESAFDPSAPLPEFIGESEAFESEEKLLAGHLLEIETKISAKLTEAQYQKEAAESIPALLAEIEALKAEKAEAKHTHDLLKLAFDTLTEAKETLSSRYLSGIEGSFKGYLDLLESQNSEYHFNTELSVSVERYGERKPAEALSRGEQDLIAFCARLSLIDSIFTEETPFLLLDDPFVNLDDDNHARAFALLKRLAERFQIFYTVCSKARITE